jgi:hypothetical protein
MHEAGVSLPSSALGGPSRTLDPPVPVRAWVYTRARGWLRVVGDAVAWTPKAGMVRYVDEHGRSDAVWVWAGAIERRAAPPVSAAVPTPRRLAG